MSRKTQRVVLKSQAREIISKVYDFMKKEATENYAEKLTDARWRTAKAVRVSERTVTRILNERRRHEINQTVSVESNTEAIQLTTEPDIETLNGASTSNSTSNATVFTSPMKKRRVRARKLDIGEFEIGVVRRTIQNYQIEHGQFPTIRRLQNELRDRIQFDGSLTTLRRLLTKLGYKRGMAENIKKGANGKKNLKLKTLKTLN